MGYFYALIIIQIWSFWFVLSRIGVTISALSPIDIVFVRYLTASLILLPFVRKIPIKKIGLLRCIFISLCIGTLYNLFAIYGLKYFQSNHGAVVMAGFTPIFGSLYVALSKQKLDFRKYIAIALIFFSIILFLSEKRYEKTHTNATQTLGLVLLLLAALAYSFGIRKLDKYKLKPIELVTANAFFSFMTITPFYLIWGNFGIFRTLNPSLLFQATYQGIVVSVIAVFLVSKAITKIGSLSLSFFIACIPVMTTIFAYLMREPISVVDVFAAIVCTSGILIANLKKSKKIP